MVENPPKGVDGLEHRSPGVVSKTPPKPKSSQAHIPKQELVMFSSGFLHMYTIVAVYTTQASFFQPVSKKTQI